ncbi:MAG: hypothetical protein ACKOE6_08455 [Flammeovirgaceae bacterium]
MKRILSVMSLLLLFGFAPPKLTKTKVAEGITVALPRSLSVMTPEDIVQRYPSVRSPLAAYTDVTRSADFSVNVSATQWPDGNVEMAKKFFKAGIANLYDRVDFISEGVQTIHKKTYVFFEFESRVNGNKMTLGEQAPVYRYTYIQYLVEKDKALVFSFNCPKDLRQEWQPTVHAMMKSVKVK